MNKITLGSLVAGGMLVAYYYVKPMIPQRIRYFARGLVAHRARRRSAESWPIKPGTERPPPGWPGWPEGKRFAFVLTHDVEGQRGLDLCQPLMALEEQCGFRSSFNFIPEGEYAVPAELRVEMARRGFEVGVHDLRHDGKLYLHRDGFRRCADRINHYVAEWRARGFRAGFMRHNLRWQLGLRVKYDASTFDVDPFEPQPDGVDTIFPFRVHGESAEHMGYIELPYTLVQDSTLFLFLRERTIDLWKRKLDWIAEHGGMALVITHPDYMDFSSGTDMWDRYPASLYREYMEYVATKYRGQYWHALPHEVADYCDGFMGSPDRQESSLPEDAAVAARIET